MVSGGTRKRIEAEPNGVPPSRTTLVLDHLLSRGSFQWPSATTAWPSVRHVLHGTAPTLLAGHLTWLGSRTRHVDHLSAPRIMMEDQARILIRALDERDEDDLITCALDRPWTADDVPDDSDDVITYASALRRATDGEPAGSPFAALAQSAAKLAAEILGQRGSSTTRRHFA